MINTKNNDKKYFLEDLNKKEFKKCIKILNKNIDKVYFVIDLLEKNMQINNLDIEQSMFITKLIKDIDLFNEDKFLNKLELIYFSQIKNDIIINFLKKEMNEKKITFKVKNILPILLEKFENLATLEENKLKKEIEYMNLTNENTIWISNNIERMIYLKLKNNKYEYNILEIFSKKDKIQEIKENYNFIKNLANCLTKKIILKEEFIMWKESEESIEKIEKEIKIGLSIFVKFLDYTEKHNSEESYVNVFKFGIREEKYNENCKSFINNHLINKKLDILMEKKEILCEEKTIKKRKI